MFMFPDGRPFVLRFNQVEQRYYAAFVDRFPEADVSISQWRGGYEYQTLYPAIQMMVENGMMTLDALNEVLGVIAATNQSIYRPAVLQSRVAERFAQAGYEATARIATLETRGILAICVDQERGPFDYNSVLTPSTGAAISRPDETGFRVNLYGAMTNQDLYKTQINALTTYSTEIDVIYADFAQPLSLSSFVMSIGGVDVTFNPVAALPAHSYAATNNEAYTMIRGSVGVGLGVFVAGGGSYEAINDDDAVIGDLIRDEMLPAGQHMEGDIIYPTALSNGQAIDIKWTVPIPDNIDHRVTITRKRGSPYPENTVDEIIEMFLANFDGAMGIGSDLTPQVYLTVRDIPWASSVLVEWYDGVSWHTTDLAAAYNMKYIGLLPPANVVIA